MIVVRTRSELNVLVNRAAKDGEGGTILFSVKFMVILITKICGLLEQPVDLQHANWGNCVTKWGKM
jgi:hypothetical protein